MLNPKKQAKIINNIHINNLYSFAMFDDKHTQFCNCI